MDINNAMLDCFSHSESVDDDKYELKNSDTTDDDNKNTGYSYFRTSKKSLSAGAIVGIVLGCVAALALIIGILLCLKNIAKATVYPTQNIDMSSGNGMVPTESNVPVDYSKKIFMFNC